MEGSEVKYILLKLIIIHGQTEIIEEIELFENRREAECFLEKNKDRFQTAGHHFTGRTEYVIKKKQGDKYFDFNGEEYMGFFSFEPEGYPSIIRMK